MVVLPAQTETKVYDDYLLEGNLEKTTMHFIRIRSSSLLTLVLVLFIIFLLQGAISYSTTFGILDKYIPDVRHSMLSTAWLVIRFVLLLFILTLWFLNKKGLLFKSLIIFNGILTLGLIMNLTALGDVLLGISAQAIKTLLIGVVFMVIANILIFSIWYWIIDPPGVEETLRDDAPWDFLFPQRADSLPHYESWLPRYTDYLYLAFTTSFAFSPTDTMPLTRRAKLLMLLQASISIITLTAIAGGAINILAGSR